MTDDIKELVRRLKNCSKEIRGAYHQSMYLDAAHALEQQAAEIVRLTENYDWQREDLLKECDKIDELEDEIVRLREENEWIKTDERLPEDYGYYTCSDGRNVYEAYFGHPPAAYETSFYCSEEMGSLELETSHWKERAKPPTEKS